MRDLTTFQWLILLAVVVGIWVMTHCAGLILEGLVAIRIAVDGVKSTVEELRSAVDDIQSTLDRDEPARDQFDADG